MQPIVDVLWQSPALNGRLLEFHGVEVPEVAPAVLLATAVAERFNEGLEWVQAQLHLDEVRKDEIDDLLGKPGIIRVLVEGPFLTNGRRVEGVRHVLALSSQ